MARRTTPRHSDLCVWGSYVASIKDGILNINDEVSLGVDILKWNTRWRCLQQQVVVFDILQAINCARKGRAVMGLCWVSYLIFPRPIMIAEYKKIKQQAVELSLSEKGGKEIHLPTICLVIITKTRTVRPLYVHLTPFLSSFFSIIPTIPMRIISLTSCAIRKRSFLFYRILRRCSHRLRARVAWLGIYRYTLYSDEIRNASAKVLL